MSIKKKSSEYFDRFLAMAAYSCQAAETLREILAAFSPAELPAKMEQMHRIEHAADNTRHELIRLLDKDFLPPIDRDDILRLACHLDDVTDAIEDVLQRIYMYNVQHIRPEAHDMGDVLVKGCLLLQKIMEEFPGYKRSDSLHAQIVEVNRLEEVGDHLYVDATHSLCAAGGDPLAVLAWAEVFRCFETCFDCCEHAANAVENIVMKHT